MSQAWSRGSPMMPMMDATMLCATTRAISSERDPVFGTPHGTGVCRGGSTCTATPAA